MTVEPKKKKLRPNERFVWGPGVGPEVFFSLGIFAGEKSLTKQWWTVAFFQLFWGGWKCLLTVNSWKRFILYFFHGETQQVRKYNDPVGGWKSKQKASKNYGINTLKVVSLTILLEIEMVKMFQSGWNDNKFHFHFWWKFDFHFPWRWTSPLSTGETRWNLGSGWLASASDPRHHHACPWRWSTKMPRPSHHRRRKKHRRWRVHRYRKRRRLDKIVERDWEGKIHKSTECVYKWMQAIIYLHISITYIIYTYRYEQKVYLWFSWQEVRCLTSFVFVDFGKNPVFSFVLWITWMKTSFKIGEVILQSSVAHRNTCCVWTMKLREAFFVVSKQTIGWRFSTNEGRLW